MPEIPTKLMGYKRLQVDEHLEQLQGLQEKENSITHKLQVSRRKRELLGQAVDILLDERDRLLKSQELARLVLTRAQELVMIIEAAAQQEIQDICQKSKQKVAILENDYVELEKIVNKVREETGAIIQYVCDSAQQILAGAMKEMLNPNEAIQEMETLNLFTGFSGSGKINVPGGFTEVTTAREDDREVDLNKYLVGSLVGEDLVDKSGRVIIPKSGMITPEVIAVAQKEGALAELIVHAEISELPLPDHKVSPNSDKQDVSRGGSAAIVKQRLQECLRSG